MGTFKNLNLEQAEQYVSDNTAAFWDGWDMIIWRPNPNGFFKKNGMLRGGKWGTAVRVSPNSQGLYKVRA